MSKQRPTRLDVDLDAPDFHCPFCEASLIWDDNLYAFEPENVICSDCQKEFIVTKKVLISFHIRRL